MREYRGKRVDGKGWVEGDLLNGLSVEPAKAFIVCGYVHKMIFLDVQRIYYCTETYEVIPESVKIKVCGQWFSEKELSDIVKKGLTDDSN